MLSTPRCAVAVTSPEGTSVVDASVRQGSAFNYTISGLTPGAEYLLRLHFTGAQL